MKNIILLLLLTPTLSFGKIVSYWYTKSDTLTQGGQSYVAIKYDAIANYGPTDTVTFSLANTPFQSGVSSQQVLCKMNIHDIDTITKNIDGTVWIKFNLSPTFNIGNASISITYCSVFPEINIISATPDVNFVSSDDLHVIPGQKFKFVISYTYKFSSLDTIKITLNGTQISKLSFADIKAHHDTISFIIPNYTTGTYTFSFNYWGINWDPLYLTNTTTGILDPYYNIVTIVRYYNIQGEEIKKPTEGFFIWKSNKGESGKSMLVY